MAEITGIYTALLNELIEYYGITICDGKCPCGSPCVYRNHGMHFCNYFNTETGEHKKIKDWKQENSIESTYILLCEIGHMVYTYKKKYLNRCNIKVVDEYEAAVFAIRKCRKLGLNLTRDIVVDHQRKILKIYRRETASCRNNHLFGTGIPDWVKTAEDYSIVKIYDKVYEFDLKEYVRQLKA